MSKNLWVRNRVNYVDQTFTDDKTYNIPYSVSIKKWFLFFCEVENYVQQAMWPVPFPYRNVNIRVQLQFTCCNDINLLLDTSHCSVVMELYICMDSNNKILFSTYQFMSKFCVFELIRFDAQYIINKFQHKYGWSFWKANRTIDNDDK